MVDVPTVTVAELEDDAFFLDVREDDEWAAGHIDGAVHIPMDQLLARRGDIPSDREVVFVCRVGGRSGQATEYFAREGCRVENLDGGMLAWEGAGRPMTTDDGSPAFVL